MTCITVSQRLVNSRGLLVAPSAALEVLLMSRRLLSSGVLVALLIGFSISADVGAQRIPTAASAQSAEQAIASWRAKPREVAQQMIFGVRLIEAQRASWYRRRE